MLENEPQCRLGDQLKGRQAGIESSACRRQHRNRGCRIRQGQPGRRLRGGLREKLEHRRRNDSQRAFGADKQMFEIVARVVLA